MAVPYGAGITLTRTSDSDEMHGTCTIDNGRTTLRHHPPDDPLNHLSYSLLDS
jgi:hypothetical protein